MNFVVGCPVSNRMWIFPRWIEHVQDAFRLNGLPEPAFAFVTNVNDNTLQTFLYDNAPRNTRVFNALERPDEGMHRRWSRERYAYMANLRNWLLGLLRDGDDLFLSIDSDILLHQDTLWCMLETLDAHPEAWAVGGKVHLRPPPSKSAPNYGKWKPNGGFRRADSDGVFEVDTLMALKLMRPPAFATPYERHDFGEDFGWSRNVKRLGGELWWDGRVASKHVMSPEWLDKPDPRLGW